MSPVILTEAPHQPVDAGSSGKTTPDQDQLLIKFLTLKLQCHGIGKENGELTAEEERTSAEFRHAEELVMKSGVPESVIRAVCPCRNGNGGGA